MGRINALVNCMIGDLAGLKSAGTVKDVVVADQAFADVISGRGGKYDVPLLGVAYAGAAKAGPMETGGLVHEADNQVSVFAAVRHMGGTVDELPEIYDLLDAIFDAAAGKVPILRGRDGTAILDESGAEQRIASPWQWLGDKPQALPAEAAKKNLRCWVVSFACHGAYEPDRGEDSYFEELEGTIDPRPGEDPETPEADLAEVEIAEDEWE